ncbi:MAG: CotS family spore coat protein [Clostridia bacterium]|nr:CotS family spore coat protein [Clostridia bacterium]
MPSASNEPLQQILSKYSLEVLNTRNESYKDKKGVWWVKTPEGYRILKKISNSEDTLKYILSAVRHLNKNGINIPEVIVTKDKSDYVVLNGTCYLLTKAVEGKNPSYDIPQQLEAVVKELANFHKASRGFSPLPDSKPKIHLGTWIEDYEQQLEDMNSFYKKELASESRDEIGKFITAEFPAFYSRGHKAIEGLKGTEYRDWVEKVKKTGGLCHQDFAAGNLFITASGDMYVIDTDSITLDIPARDIRKLLNKIMKKRGKWDIELTRKILAYYQSGNPLTSSEWQVVKLDIMFPHLFIGAMNKYYYKREKEWTNANYFKRLKEVTVIEKTISPVLDKFESIIPK